MCRLRRATDPFTARANQKNYQEFILGVAPPRVTPTFVATEALARADRGERLIAQRVARLFFEVPIDWDVRPSGQAIATRVPTSLDESRRLTRGAMRTRGLLVRIPANSGLRACKRRTCS